MTPISTPTTRPLRIAIDLGPYPFRNEDRQRLNDAIGPVECVALSHAANADVLIAPTIPQDISSLQSLQLVQLLGAGVDHLEGHPIWQTPTAVATASGIGHVSIAQYCLGMVLNHYHQLPAAMAFGQTRAWPDRLKLGSTALRGRTACIYGYGSIGRETARLLSTLGVRIVAVNRSGRRTRDDGYNAWPGTGDPDGSIPDQFFSPSSLGDAAAQADILIVTAPATSDTRGSVDAAMLARMPAGAMVVIVSRGGIVDETALAAALISGHLRAAAVDTFVAEPPPTNHPLFGIPGAMLTPHISGIFDDYMEAIWMLAIENIRRLRSGRRILNNLNPR